MLHSGNHALAKTDLDQANKLKENDPEITYLMGLYFEKTNDLSAALSYYLKAKQLDYSHHGLDFKIEILKNRT